MKMKAYAKIALLLIVVMAIAACRGAPPAQPPVEDLPLTEIENRFWLLTEVRGEDISIAINRQALAAQGVMTIFTLRLDSNDGTLGGTGSLNAYWGPYALSPDRSLSFGDIQTTGGESRTVSHLDEEVFLGLLAGVTRWSDMGSNLVLHTSGHGGVPVTMIFAPPTAFLGGM
ncbi:MAG: META domain-containing protein [Spirochaetes bacterium]|nr:META domain-containing protein [Spirochaetota bacterium]